jgi:Tol biopolymer transport system component
MRSIFRLQLLAFFALVLAGQVSAAEAPKSSKPASAQAAPQSPAAPRSVIWGCVQQRGRSVIMRMDLDGSGRVFLSQSREAFLPSVPAADRGNAWCPVAAPNGKLVAFYSDRNGVANLWLMNANGRRQQAITEASRDIAQLSKAGQGQIAFSPDSQRLAFLKNGMIWIYDLATSSLHSLNSDQGVRCLDWAKDKDGKVSLVYVRDNSLVTATQTSPVVTTLIADAVTDPQLLCDRVKGLNVYFFRNGIWSVNLKEKVVKRIITSLVHPNQMDLSPDGNTLCLLAESPDHLNEVFLVGTDGRATRLTSGGAEDCFYAPDGRKVYFLRKGLVWIIGTDGRNAKPIIQTPVSCPSIGAFLPQEAL